MTENKKNIASGRYSHAEGVSTNASEYYSHAEGCMTTASGAYSHSEGYNTTANNDYEHAEGICNKSNSGETSADKTQHSIGIGTGINDRKNAVEVMANGDVYINGVGSYDGMKQYNNYLTEDEASQILSNFVNYDGTKGAMFKNSMWLFNRLTEQNLHCECAPNYNKWALYVTMNKFASDQGNVINKWIGEDKDKFIIACYDLSTAQLSDADRPHWVRSYFNL